MDYKFRFICLYLCLFYDFCRNTSNNGIMFNIPRHYGTCSNDCSNANGHACKNGCIGSNLSHRYLCFLKIVFIVSGLNGERSCNLSDFTMWSVPCLYFKK